MLLIQEKKKRKYMNMKASPPVHCRSSDMIKRCWLKKNTLPIASTPYLDLRLAPKSQQATKEGMSRLKNRVTPKSLQVREMDRKDRKCKRMNTPPNSTNSILRLPKKQVKRVAETARRHQRKGKGITVAAGRHREEARERKT